ncbi:hypothetical protein ACS0TY_007353 [Phlomoides rotata]
MRSEDGRPFKLKEKLKFLKADIKQWSQTQRGNMETNIAHMTEEIQKLDAIDDTSGLEEEEINDRNLLMKKLVVAMNRKEDELIQKAKIRWAKDGDANSALFHRAINHRNNRNSISGIWAQDRWLDSEELKDAIWECDSTASPGVDG